LFNIYSIVDVEELKLGFVLKYRPLLKERDKRVRSEELPNVQECPQGAAHDATDDEVNTIAGNTISKMNSKT
jgi:hypothetical protein